jgi:hypothetical protein
LWRSSQKPTRGSKSPTSAQQARHQSADLLQLEKRIWRPESSPNSSISRSARPSIPSSSGCGRSRHGKTMAQKELIEKALTNGKRFCPRTSRVAAFIPNPRSRALHVGTNEPQSPPPRIDNSSLNLTRIGRQEIAQSLKNILAINYIISIRDKIPFNGSQIINVNRLNQPPNFLSFNIQNFNNIFTMYTSII